MRSAGWPTWDRRKPVHRRGSPVWVDAFTDHTFAGNPAAVCLLDGPAPDGWMQALASELGLSETAFVWPAQGELSLRWFTPSEEVLLCGHATLASAHALRETGHWRRWVAAPVDADGEEIAFRTKSGRILARFDGPVIELDFPADRPVALATPVPDAVAAWGPRAVVAGSMPMAERGTDLLVELASAGAVRSLAPGLGAVAGLPHRLVAVTAPGDEPGIDYVVRVFAPAVGVDEDPVTGSAQCLLAPYWSSRLGNGPLEVAQVSARGGRLRVAVVGDRVRVAGLARTVLTGQLAPAAGPPGAAAPVLPHMGPPEP